MASARIERQRRRQPARVHDRHHRLPRVHAATCKDLRTGELLEQPAEKVDVGRLGGGQQDAVLHDDDAAKRPYRLYRHALGADGGGTLLYEEKDERFSVGVGRSRSKAYLFLELGSLTDDRGALPAPPTSRPATWQIVAPREDEHEYDVDHRGDQFYIRTNEGGRNFRAGDGAGERSAPAQLEGARAAPRRRDARGRRRCFADHDVLHEREDGLPQLRVTDAGAEAPTHDDRRSPSRSTPCRRPATPSSTTPTFRFALPVVHDAAVGVRLRHRDRRSATLLKQTEVLGGYDPAQLRVRARATRRRRTAPRSRSRSSTGRTLSRDGTQPAAA